MVVCDGTGCLRNLEGLDTGLEVVDGSRRAETVTREPAAYTHGLLGKGWADSGPGQGPWQQAREEI